MKPELWLAFAGAYFLTTLSPGPNVLLVIRNSLRHGASAAPATILGNLASQAIMVILVASGVGALLATLPVFFLVLKVAGALYLFHLGIGQWRNGQRQPVVDAMDTDARQPSSGLWKEAFLVSGSNPKTLIFFTAFMPQFIDRQHALPLQFAIMYATVAGIVLCVHLIYAVSAQRIGRYRLRPAIRQGLSRLCGSLFILLGIRLLASQRG